MKYKAVLFDIFGTLILMEDLETELDEWLGRFHECLQPHGLNMPRDDFDKVCFNNFEENISIRTSDGFTIFEHRVHTISSNLGLELKPEDIKNTVVSLLEVWNKYAAIDPECHPLLKKLGQCYTLGVVSNFDHPPYIRRILKDLKLEDYFGMIVISGEHDFKKPDPRIFQLALKEINLTPEDVIYIGDSEEDIVGARAAGIEPVLVQRDTDLTNVPEVFKKEYTKTDVKTINKLSELLEILEG